MSLSKSRAKSHIPEGLRAVTAQLVVADARRLIAFCEAAFGAEVMDLMPAPDGGVMHGHMRIGDTVLFLSDAKGFAVPTAANLFVYVPDADRTVAAAVSAGAKVAVPLADMFWGDRWGMVEDPFGNIWQIATHQEDLTPDEMKRRMAAGGAPP
ncbi:MAG TPA: VOC family protein [Kofleriaceae bacterium]|nr:VOC family protein [Kofleriaceae bacterium]